MRKKKRYFSRATCFVLCAVFALLFLLPTVLTITHSFMTQSEITASYGQVLDVYKRQTSTSTWTARSN